jgi:hypothetical protein
LSLKYYIIYSIKYFHFLSSDSVFNGVSGTPDFTNPFYFSCWGITFDNAAFNELKSNYSSYY